MTTGWKTHTLSVLVEDKPGVLARVAALFSRRGGRAPRLRRDAHRPRRLRAGGGLGDALRRRDLDMTGALGFHSR